MNLQEIKKVIEENFRMTRSTVLELVAETERLHKEIDDVLNYYDMRIDDFEKEVERLQEELRIAKLPDHEWVAEYTKRRKAGKI